MLVLNIDATLAVVVGAVETEVLLDEEVGFDRNPDISVAVGKEDDSLFLVLVGIGITTDEGLLVIAVLFSDVSATIPKVLVLSGKFDETSDNAEVSGLLYDGVDTEPPNILAGLKVVVEVSAGVLLLPNKVPEEKLVVPNAGLVLDTEDNDPNDDWVVVVTAVLEALNGKEVFDVSTGGVIATLLPVALSITDCKFAKLDASPTGVLGGVKEDTVCGTDDNGACLVRVIKEDCCEPKMPEPVDETEVELVDTSTGLF